MIRSGLTIALVSALPAAADSLPLTARGNEPGWVLTMSSDGLVFSAETGERVEAVQPRPAPMGLGTRYSVAPDFHVEVMPGLCHDSMTGMPYPVSVAVVRDAGILTGCGGDPRSLLQGDWQAEALLGNPVDGMTLRFEGDQLAGQSACNRYSTTLSLTGEALSLGAPVATRMACAPEKMQAETAFFDALARVTGFDIDSEGALVLQGDGTDLLRARR